MNSQTQKFETRESVVSVVINIENSQKNGGSFTFDLCEVLNPLRYKDSATKQFEVPLEKCPIKKSKIYLKLSATFISEMVQGDR